MRSHPQCMIVRMPPRSSQDVNIGANVANLRKASNLSLDVVAEAMRGLGHSWSKTTLFGIEHSTRRLLASEAFDLLRCLGYDPEKDLMLIYGAPPSPIDYSMRQCAQRAHDMESAWNSYLGVREQTEKTLTDETEEGNITKEYADAQRKKLRLWETSMSEAIEEGRSERGSNIITFNPRKLRDE